MLQIRDVDQVMRWWHFFRNGLEVINRETKWNESRENFFRMLVHVIKIGDRKGQLLIQVDGALHPLGFLVAADNTPPFGDKSALIYAVYSNKLVPSTFMELIAEVSQWAMTEEYKQVQAVSYRLNRTSVKLFKKYLPDRKFMVFTKVLNGTHN